MDPAKDDAPIGSPRFTEGFWAGWSGAVAFLLPIGRFASHLRDTSLSVAVNWFVPMGLLIGLAWTGVFKAAWRIYGETANMRIVPALAIILLECLVTGPLLVLGLARTVDALSGSRSGPRKETDSLAPFGPLGTLAICLVLLSEWVLIASIPAATGWWPSSEDWRYQFRALYAAPIYRPLLLAPLWGRWGILLAATIGRTAGHADAQTKGLCESMIPGRLLAHSLIPIAMTSIYLSRDGNLVIGVVVGLLVFASTHVGCVVMARIGGGQTRQSLFAAGQISQLAFLAFYRAFWRVIHG